MSPSSAFASSRPFGSQDPTPAPSTPVSPDDWLVDLVDSVLDTPQAPPLVVARNEQPQPVRELAPAASAAAAEALPPAIPCDTPDVDVNALFPVRSPVEGVATNAPSVASNAVAPISDDALPQPHLAQATRAVSDADPDRALARANNVGAGSDVTDRAGSERHSDAAAFLAPQTRTVAPTPAPNSSIELRDEIPAAPPSPAVVEPLAHSTGAFDQVRGMALAGRAPASGAVPSAVDLHDDTPAFSSVPSSNALSLVRPTIVRVRLDLESDSETTEAEQRARDEAHEKRVAELAAQAKLATTDPLAGTGGESRPLSTRLRSTASLGIFDTPEKYNDFLLFMADLGISENDPMAALIELLGINKAVHDHTIARLRDEDARTGRGVAVQGQRVLDGLADLGESHLNGLHDVLDAFLRTNNLQLRDLRLAAVQLATGADSLKSALAQLDLTEAVDQARFTLESIVDAVVDRTERTINARSNEKSKAFGKDLTDLANGVVQDVENEFAKIIDQSLDRVSASCKKFEDAAAELEKMAQKEITLARGEIVRERSELAVAMKAKQDQAVDGLNAAAVSSANTFSKLMAANVKQHAMEMGRAVDAVTGKLNRVVLTGGVVIAGLMVLAKLLW